MKEKKNKCLCGKKTHDSHCPRCGLYIGEVNLKYYLTNIDEFIEKLDTKKKFNIYTKYDEDRIVIHYQGMKKLMDYIGAFFYFEINVKEFNTLLHLISFLSFEYDECVTSMLITLFGLVSVSMPPYEKYLNYWLKKGMKEGLREAYYIYSCSEKISKRKRKKIQAILRSIPEGR